MEAGCLAEGRPRDLGVVFGVLFGCRHGVPGVGRQVGQHVDEVKPAERGSAAGAGGELVLHPSQLGSAGQGGDVEAEFLAELAGERGRDLFVSVDEAAGQRVLVAAGPLTVDQRGGAWGRRRRTPLWICATRAP